MKKNKISLVTIICFFIIIILMAVIFFMYSIIKKQYTNNIIEKNIEKEKIEISKNEEEEVKEPNVTIKKEVEKYIEEIYPIPGETPRALPIFDNIEEADKEWIWSTAIRYARDEDEISIYKAKKSKIEQAAKELYGDKIGDFPGESRDLSIEKEQEEDEYYWMGNQASIEESFKYKIKSIEKEGELYKIEIAEYIIHDWGNGIYIADIKGNKQKTFVTAEQAEKLDYDIDKIDEEIEKYVKENIDKMDTKTIKIEYDKNTDLYHIVSVKEKQKI